MVVPVSTWGQRNGDRYREWSANGLADLRFGAHRARLPTLGPAAQPQSAEQPGEDDEAVEAAGRRHGHGHAGAGGADPEAQAEQGTAVDVPALRLRVR